MKCLLMWRMSLLIVTVLTVATYTGGASQAREIWVSRAIAAPRAPRSAPIHAKPSEGAMQVNSKVISPGADFPKRETCDGQDVSPQLGWSGAPAETKSYALILDDPDAPGGTFTHWLVWNIPASTHELPENVPKTAELPSGARQGRNDFGKIGYGGPCPPPGKPHRYFFRVYALDTMLDVKPGAGRKELERAMQGHILSHGELMGRYGR